MSDEKDEDLETLAEAEEPQPPPAKAKQYKKAETDDARRKKELTPAQIAAFEKCRAKREENRALRKQEREQVRLPCFPRNVFLQCPPHFLTLKDVDFLTVRFCRFILSPNIENIVFVQNQIVLLRVVCPPFAADHDQVQVLIPYVEGNQ